MRVAMIDIGLKPMEGIVKRSQQTQDFQMVLGSVQKEALLTEPIQGDVQQKNITNLIEFLLNPSEIELEGIEQFTSLEEWIEHEYPEFEVILSELMSWINQNLDQKLNLNELEGNYLKTTLHLFQSINKIDLRAVADVPVNSLIDAIKIGKKLPEIAMTMSISIDDMDQLTKLDQSLLTLLDQLQSNISNKTSLESPFTGVKQTAGDWVHTNSRLVTSTPNSGISVESMINQPDASRTEVFTMTVAKPSSEEFVGRSFVRELTNIIGKANLSTNGNTSKLFIKLYPEELGTLRVELIQKDGLLTARFLATTARVKELLDQQMSSLRQAFQHQNLFVEKIEVSYSDSSPLQYTEHHHQEQGGHEQHSQDEQKKENDQSNFFHETLSEILFEEEV